MRVHRTQSDNQPVAQVAVEVVDVLAGEDAKRPTEDLLRRPIVDLESARLPPCVDPEAQQADSVIVDALMGVAGNEEVVRSGRNCLAEETPLSRVQILCFVDDDVHIRMSRTCGE